MTLMNQNNGNDKIKSMLCLGMHDVCCCFAFETLSLTLWEEHVLRVFENRMPKKIFRPKRSK
jgi:hypothetical protein